MPSIKPRFDNIKKIYGNQLSLLIPIIISIVALIVLSRLLSTQLFGWDESVYLAKARALIEGTPSNQFIIYRPIGMVIVGWILLHINATEIGVRFFGVIFGAICGAVIYILFKTISNNVVGVIAALVTISSSLFLLQAPQFFNDIPSAALIIITLILIYKHFRSDGKSKTIYIASVLAAIAFYLRYGTISTLGIIGLISIVILFSKFEKNEDASYSHLMRSLILFVVLILPFFIYSQFRLGGFFSILTLSNKAAGTAGIGTGLLDYVQWLPFQIGGWLLGITSILGVVATIIISFRKGLREHYIAFVWLGLIAIADFIIKGVFVHAEARYVFVPVVLLSGIGVAAIYFVICRFAPKFTWLLLMISLIIIGLAGITNFRLEYKYYQSRDTDPYNIIYKDASTSIIRNSNKKCVLWSAAARPTLAYYAKCTVLPVPDSTRFAELSSFYKSYDQYSVVFTKRKTVQIDADYAAKFFSHFTEIYGSKRLTNSFQGNVIVYKMY